MDKSFVKTRCGDADAGRNKEACEIFGRSVRALRIVVFFRNICKEIATICTKKSHVFLQKTLSKTLFFSIFPVYNEKTTIRDKLPCEYKGGRT